MHCFIEKARVFFLLTLALDKSKINQFVEILQEYFKLFDLINDIISKKIIIIKEDWLIFKNVHIAMYQYISKIIKLDIFK